MLLQSIRIWQPESDLYKSFGSWNVKPQMSTHYRCLTFGQTGLFFQGACLNAKLRLLEWQPEIKAVEDKQRG
jgi:hypothetical protein